MNSRNNKSKDPVIILAPNGSKGSVFAAALGRHPDLFAGPHLNLLAFEDLRQLVRFARVPRDIHMHGIVRMLSWLLIGEQSVEGVQAARRWITRYGGMDTKALYRTIGAWLQPRRLVEYSPLYVYHRNVVERVVAAAENARFIHLVRHPTATAMEIARAAAQTVDTALGRYTGQDPNQPCLDIMELVDTAVDWQSDPPVFDPQYLWYRAHTSIAAVLAEVPRSRVMRVRIEDVLADPETALGAIIRWLRLPVTADVLREMLRIDQDTFARPGPFGASRGVDWDIMLDPTFPELNAAAPMIGTLPWRNDGFGYCPEVIELAEQLGYRPMGGLAPPQTRLKITPPSTTLSSEATVSR